MFLWISGVTEIVARHKIGQNIMVNVWVTVCVCACVCVCVCEIYRFVFVSPSCCPGLLLNGGLRPNSSYIHNMWESQLFLQHCVFLLCELTLTIINIYSFYLLIVDFFPFFSSLKGQRKSHILIYCKIWIPSGWVYSEIL